jgi:Lhr-like helicase
MNVFELSRSVIAEYENFSRSFTRISASDIKAQIDAEYASKRFWPEPTLQINPRFKDGATVAELVKQRLLHPACGSIFKDWQLRTHQSEAIVLDHGKKSFVVTTGTGSGKSICYFIPIINSALTSRPSEGRRRTRAIVIYPMNALANSQVGELNRYFTPVATEHKVSYALYTGQENDVERQKTANNPPDILLTNFMMLELLMTRQDELDRAVIENCIGLDYLVLDEIHTYRGRQGADVAMLVRRVRDRLARGKTLRCIGTSATMTSEGGDRGNEVVAKVASELFATTITKDCVIGETLERVTDITQTADSVKAKLAAAIKTPVPGDASNDLLRKHPLAIWAETRMGITPETPGGRWIRAKPLSLSAAAERLMADSGLKQDACRRALEDLFLVASKPEQARCGVGSQDPFFGVRLHQFISGAGRAYATIEPWHVRRVVFDGQKFLPGSENEKRLYALHFCHNCGQEHHPIWFENSETRVGLDRREIDDVPISQNGKDDADRKFGFFMPIPEGGIDFKGEPDDYPDTWTETARDGSTRLISRYRPYAFQRLSVRPDGTLGAGGVDGWFQPEKFRFCAACGELTASKGSDRYRLAGLTAEGRSSATTILVASILKWMHGQGSAVDEIKRKILGFTDNRQDAALQAGHFNDFVFVSLLRAAMICALKKAGPDGIEDADLGRLLQRALGFDQNNPDCFAEWLADPKLEGPLLNNAERAMRDVLAHRAWGDQRRTWRATNPNLERLGLMKIEYKGLDALCANEDKFKEAHGILKNASPNVRKKAFTKLFDHMRRSLAVATDSLDGAAIESLQRRSSELRSPWTLADERPLIGAALVLDRSQRANIPAEEELLRLRGGPTSALGRAICASDIWGRRLTAREYRDVVRGLIAAAENLIVRKRPMFMGERIENWDLYANAIVFKATDTVSENDREPNRFFREFYLALAGMIDTSSRAVFAFEAREHTAQVETKTRQIREARFRWRKEDREKLKTEEYQAKLQEVADTDTFLPVLVCSPTMELGVDIAELDTVYLRNVPPTPANYAQRSGRAGRGGQPALIITYCAAQSPHDQYFFRDPAQVVQGIVRAPTIDLANQDLVESHLQAIWLAETRAALSSRIAEVVDLERSERPIRDAIAKQVEELAVGERSRVRIRSILDDLFGDGRRVAGWLGEVATYTDRIVAEAPARFNATFQRWRNLLASAEQQYREANETFTRHNATREEHRMAERLRDLAGAQIKLLRDGSDSAQSDYYTYRYLATEGFLPGYNFPRLPLTAYVTTGRTQKSQSVIQRPRFLGISEFGPRSLVYHEGRAHRVVRVLLNAGASNGNGELATHSFYICKSCGAAHEPPKPEFCHACAATLADADQIMKAYRIENVQTAPTTRITANDEERQRQGFEIRTVFEWPTRDNGRKDIREAVIADDAGVIASVAFGPAAVIRRFNVGLRRRDPAAGMGFHINPRNGFWARAPGDEDDDSPQDPTKAVPQQIVPYVVDRKNALLLRFDGNARETAEMAGLQYALIRGIELIFQLEEGEVLAESLPSRNDRRAILIYEAAEGGAGVLSRLVDDAASFANVVMKAIEICHFDVKRFKAEEIQPGTLQDVPDAKCVAGCYRCLLSYYNQIDHDVIDRRDPNFREILVRLARARVVPVDSKAPPKEDADTATNAFRAAIVAHGLQPFDPKPLVVDGVSLPFAWRAERVVALYEDQHEKLRALLDERSLIAICMLRGNEADPGVLARLAAVLTGVTK